LKNTNNDIIDEQFDELFREYYKSLRAYAFRYVNDLFIAEDIVQDVFSQLWEKKNKLNEIASVRSYLFTSVFNRATNYLKHKNIESQYQTKQIDLYQSIENYYQQFIVNTSESIIAKELEKQIIEIVNGLPEQCKNVFLLSRYYGLKNHEIANRLGVSVKAIEKQITKALQSLRSGLKDYLFMIILIFKLFQSF
jgi:RNA polymerase sigma-70 factor (ECF subfamily)